MVKRCSIVERPTTTEMEGISPRNIPKVFRMESEVFRGCSGAPEVRNMRGNFGMGCLNVGSTSEGLRRVSEGIGMYSDGRECGYQVLEVFKMSGVTGM